MDDTRSKGRTTVLSPGGVVKPSAPLVLNPLTSRRVIVAVNQGGDRRKMFQLMFLKDGSLTVSFPYFKEAACQLAIGTMPPAPMPRR
jgi:hypothetical protein